MDSTCVLCFEDMDMSTFQDDRDSTETCFKLECGHSFHTKCIVNCLQKSNHVCPQCNKQKDPESKLTIEGLATRLFVELRKHPDVKIAIHESKQAKIELRESLDTLTKETKEFVEKRKVELCILEKRKYLLDSLANVKSVIKATAHQFPPKYQGCVGYFSGWKLEKLIFGVASYRYMYRLRVPRIYIPIK